MSDDTMRLAGWFAAGLYEDAMNHNGPWRHGGETYRVASDEQYAALGEDVTAVDLPLIVVRASDGKMFEVELDAHVTETSIEQREQQRERFREMHERIKASQLEPRKEPPQ
jgi:hypothetical protein